MKPTSISTIKIVQQNSIVIVKTPTNLLDLDYHKCQNLPTKTNKINLRQKKPQIPPSFKFHTSNAPKCDRSGTFPPSSHHIHPPPQTHQLPQRFNLYPDNHNPKSDIALQTPKELHNSHQHLKTTSK